MDWFWPLLAAPFAGSFLGVLIRRLPAGGMLAAARSRCEACGTGIGLRDLVPLVSFWALSGRCRACGGRIAAQHWHVEAAAVVVACCAAVVDGGAGRLWFDCGLGWALLALAWIDWEHLMLPDAITLSLIPAGLVATWWLAPAAATDHAVAAALGYTALRLLGLGYWWLRGREGIGAGDAKLLAALGAWVGLESLPLVLLGAALLGLGLALALRLGGRVVTGGTALPFGCCLALAGWVVWLQG